MNELEARRQLMVDPRRVSPELQAHLETSPQLAALRDELLRLDAEMHRELTHSAAPDGLAERIVLGARYRDHSRRSFLAAAASMGGLAVIASAYLGTRGPSLEHAMIEHIALEVDELRDNTGVDPAKLRTAVAALGVEVLQAGYRIRHLAFCVVAGREGRHFTIDAPHGVVSFLIVPAVSLLGPDTMRYGAMQGRFVKRGGTTIGAFAETAVDSAELDRLTRQLFA